MKRKWKIMIAFIASIIVFGAVLAGPIMSEVEQAQYDVVTKYHKDTIEIRQYAPKLIAQVTVNGERTEAISDGFKLLADYIFGNNTQKNNISMTAPVVQQSQNSQKISMTAPVMQQATQQGNTQNWTVHFVMPSDYTLSDIPKPNNDAVILKEMPTTTMIAITFSGRNTHDNVAEYEQKLLDFMQKNNITALSKPIYAFYNPPWTLPPLRCNEVLFEIKK